MNQRKTTILKKTIEMSHNWIFNMHMWTQIYYHVPLINWNINYSNRSNAITRKNLNRSKITSIGWKGRRDEEAVICNHKHSTDIHGEPDLYGYDSVGADFWPNWIGQTLWRRLITKHEWISDVTCSKIWTSRARLAVLLRDRTLSCLLLKIGREPSVKIKWPRQD